MERIIPVMDMNIFAQNFNAQREAMGVKSEKNNLEIYAAAFNAYLFLCREKGVDKDKYETIKNALQEIIEWFIMGFDIETFGELDNFEERILIEVD